MYTWLIKYIYSVQPYDYFTANLIGTGGGSRKDLTVCKELKNNTLFLSPYYFPHTSLAWLIFLLLSMFNLAHSSCIAVLGISEITAKTVSLPSVENLSSWFSV